MELNTFKKNKKCPVHCFYLGAKSAFEDISSKTGGKYSSFNLYSPRPTEDLTDFVVMNILGLIEKKNPQDEGRLVDGYKKTYGKWSKLSIWNHHDYLPK